MAGATNRAFKAAGIPKAAIKELRVTGGRGLTLRSAISLAGERGIQIPQKAHDFLAKRDAKSAQKAKPADDGAERQRRDAARAEARDVYERGNAGSRERLAGLRGDIRQRVQDVRDAEGTLRGAKGHAESTAQRAVPAAKGGPKKRQNERNRDRTIESRVANDPSVQRAAMQAKQARLRLQSALADRDATARARKQQRGAESGGQMDLFSGAPKPRAASPFERKVALRNARGRALGDLSQGMMARRKAGAAAAANAPPPSASPKLARNLAGLSRTVMAARKAGPPPERLIAAAERKHAHGIPVAELRNSARRSLVDAGTARAKMNAALAKEAAVLATRDEARRLGGRHAYNEVTQRASMYRLDANQARGKVAEHMQSARRSLKLVRKVESALPPQARVVVRPKRDATPVSSGASPEMRAKMASAKARVEELRADREKRLARQIARAETTRYVAEQSKSPGAANLRARAARASNRATLALRQAINAANPSRATARGADMAVRVAKSVGESMGKRRDVAKIRARRGES